MLYIYLFWDNFEFIYYLKDIIWADVNVLFMFCFFFLKNPYYLDLLTPFGKQFVNHRIHASNCVDFYLQE